MSEPVGRPDIILVWPKERALPAAAPIEGCTVQSLPRSLDDWWIDIHRKAVPTWGEADFRKWLEHYRSLALPDGILVATDDATGSPVATAGSIANSKGGMFPGGGQLAWVATVPEYRGRGLGSRLSSLATARLLAEGFERIFLCTGDDLTPAIRIYLRLGYLPCLYASDQRKRWQRICDIVGHSFRPDAWPTRDEYVFG